MALVVAVAEVIFVGHGDVYVRDRDHHPPFRFGAKVVLERCLSLQPSATLLRSWRIRANSGAWR